jgi:hypothetical protein
MASSSASSPAALAPTQPALYIKPEIALQTPTIVTRKEWVVPPRPKPGRKPATDTPPTKRKAQNRAAQRAFRERRAARVGELEEQLEETKEEQLKRENEMRNKITRLEAEVLRFNTELQSWKLRCDTLDQIAEYEKREKEAALAELALLRSNAGNETDAVPLMRRVRRQDLEPKPLTPAAEPDEPVEMEIDFTAQFASKPEPIQPVQEIQHSARPAEPCGFCEEGTYCMCAAASAANAEQESNLQLPPLSREILNEATPPPSDTDMEGTGPAPGTTKLRAMHPTKMHRSIPSNDATTSCANGPGSCQQCQNDPKSGLFCRSLAALRDTTTSMPASAGNPCSNGPGSCQQCQTDPKARAFCLSLSAQQSLSSPIAENGCCGGNAAGRGCCKNQNQNQNQMQTPARPPPSLSVADTYKTLSTHRNFEQASDELNTWLGRLHAAPQPQHAGRAPMEVEAASVMGVLKLFDRRFGRG